ncbi:MAG: DNRLRE domain-containing protein [Acetobacteraceae bacterium]|nr:DNRLRE domain-containing protein [Acetobacteraceae bacterium]
MRRLAVAAVVFALLCGSCWTPCLGNAAPRARYPRWYDPEDPFDTRPWLDYPVGEVPSLRGPCVRHTQNPDYTITAEIFQRPINYKAADGSYVPIDDTLVPGPAPDVYVNRSNSMKVEIVGRGPAIARVLQEGRRMEIGVEGCGLDLVTVEGNAATYADSGGERSVKVYVDGDRVAVEARNDSEAEISLVFAHSGTGPFTVTVPQVAAERKAVPRPELLQTLPGLYRVTVPGRTAQGPTVLLVATIQPGPSEGMDAEVDSEDPNHGYPVNAKLFVGYFAIEGIMRSYLRFNVSAVPRDAFIERAELQLYQDGYDGGTTCTIVPYRPKLSWTEDTITWNNQPSLVDPLTGVACGTADGWKAWDVKPYLRNWVYNTEYGNFGVCLRQNYETNNASRAFYSSDYLGDPTLRPKLVVTYTSLSRKFFDPTTNNDYVPDSGGTSYYLPDVSNKILGPLRSGDLPGAGTDYAVAIGSPCAAPRNVGGSPHCGVDMGNSNDYLRPVYPVAAGTVSGVNPSNPNDSGGLWVRVAHDVDGDGKHEFYSFYCHLANVLVTDGAPVSQTTALGQVGNTGGVETHLHLSLRTADPNLYADLPQLEFWDGASGYNSGKDVDAIHEPYKSGAYLKVVAYRTDGSTYYDYSRVYVYHRRQGSGSYYVKQQMALESNHTWSANMSSYAGQTREFYICVERDEGASCYRSYRPMYYGAGSPTDYMVPPPDSEVYAMSF